MRLPGSSNTGGAGGGAGLAVLRTSSACRPRTSRRTTSSARFSLSASGSTASAAMRPAPATCVRTETPLTRNTSVTSCAMASSTQTSTLGAKPRPASQASSWARCTCVDRRPRSVVRPSAAVLASSIANSLARSALGSVMAGSTGASAGAAATRAIHSAPTQASSTQVPMPASHTSARRRSGTLGAAAAACVGRGGGFGHGVAGPIVDAGAAERDHRAADLQRRVHRPGGLLAGGERLVAEFDLAAQHLDRGLRQVGAHPHARRRHFLFAQHDVGAVACAVRVRPRARRPGRRPAAHARRLAGLRTRAARARASNRVRVRRDPWECSCCVM